MYFRSSTDIKTGLRFWSVGMMAAALSISIVSILTICDTSEAKAQSSSNLSSLISNLSPTEQQAISNLPKTTIPVAVTITPQYPDAFTKTSVAVTSYSTNMDSADISWSVNGRVAQEGIGQKNFTFTTGKLGSITDIELKIRTQEGDIIVQSIPIQPEDVSVVWEGNTYAPPFYEGKTLFTAQSTVNVVAIPDIIDSNGNKIDPSNLIYNWQVDEQTQQQASGYGKDSFTFTGPTLLKTSNIVVDVTSLDGSIKAEGTLSLNEAKPLVLLYANDPLYGIQYNNALVSPYTLPDKEVDIAAIPYFFSASNKNSSALTYSWQINSQPIISTSSPQSDLTFRNQQNAQGNSDINVEVSSSQSVFQTASNDLNINFKPVTASF